jgi:hypothetical protein
MKSRFFSPPALACLLVTIGFGSLTLGPFMHETDQAWLLDGSTAIINGQWQAARGAFNFDKQFVSYLLPAALFSFFSRPLNANALVLAGNIFNFTFFWGALFLLMARSSRRLPLALVLPVILAPALLVHSPFYASAFTSVAFVFLLAGVLNRSAWRWWQHTVVFLMAFCAVGARADALFLLPLLAMLHSPRRTFVSVLRSPNTWLMALGGLLALLAGRMLALMVSSDFATWHFLFKLLIAYLAFGFGGAGILLLVALHAVWQLGSAVRCRLWLFFLALGLALPMLYYGRQLLSPRHCVTGVAAVLLFVCARRGRVIFQLYFRPKISGAMIKAALVLAAVLPIFVGINLDNFTRPRLTFFQPTLFPTVAGVCPMGAYLGHAIHVRTSDGLLDHNQAVWAAARQTIFQSNPITGQVEIIRTPMESYLILSAHLQGLATHSLPLILEKLPAGFYMDSRSLLRFQFIWPEQLVSLDHFFAGTQLTPTTDFDWHGITILRGHAGQPGTPDSLSAILWVMNRAFAGDEFRLETTAAAAVIPTDWEGKKLVFASRHNFTVTPAEKLSVTNFNQATLGEWHVCEISPLRPGEKFEIQGAAPDEVAVAVGALPEWMSLRKY